MRGKQVLNTVRVVTVASALAAGMLAPGAHASTRSEGGAGGPAYVTSTITWGSCAETPQPAPPPEAQCATVRAPIDYAKPSAGSINVAVGRVSAADPTKRIGALVVHPGGPGQPVVGNLGFFQWLLGKEITDRFDILAVDPRGTGRSTHLNCTPPAGTTAPPEPVTPVPTTGAEITRQITWDAYQRKICAASGGPLLNHLSTADHARDVDLIRGLLGEKQISYFGGSYGTFVGQTYAAMFPNRVRAAVLDSAVDATSYTRPDRVLPAQVRAGVDAGTSETIRSSMGICDKAGPSVCALAPNALSKYDATRAHLLRQPLQLPNSGPMTRGYLDALVASNANDPTVYPRTASLINTVHRLYTEQLDAPTRTQLLNEVATVLADNVITPPGANAWDWWGKQGMAGGQHVSCLDEPTPPVEATYPLVAAAREKDYPGGGLWVWAHSLCSGWKGSRAASYDGPWNTKLATPPLLLNTIHDSATSIAGARRTRDVIPGAHLIEVNGWGHGVLGSSDCATAAVNAYLIDKKMPTVTKCEVNPEFKLYGIGAPAAG